MMMVFERKRQLWKTGEKVGFTNKQRKIDGDAKTFAKVELPY